MQIQLTDYAIQLLQSATYPTIKLTLAKLGSGVNYVPSAQDTDIHGTTVFTTAPSDPEAVNANIVRYVVYLDYEIGPFAFGEVGLFTEDGHLFALGAANELIKKLKLTSVGWGNSIRLDFYLSMVGQNYDMWLNLAESNNQFRLASIQSVDQLPPSEMVVPNAYVVTGAASNQSTFLAYTDRQGLWNFDCYEYANTLSATVIAADSMSVLIDLEEYKTDMNPQYWGQVILQFSTGPLYSICRYVQSVILSGGSARLNFKTPIAQIPNVGDTFLLFNRQALSVSSLLVPVATKTTVGGIKVGDTLTITEDGTLDIVPLIFPVTSVNGKSGAVVITAADLTDLAKVATTGDYKDLKNTPLPYLLPVATKNTLGGVKAPPTASHIQIDSAGVIDLSFDPVKTVNGVNPDPSTGDVLIPIPVVPPGLTNPTAIPNAADLNTYSTVGLFYTATAAIASSLVNAPGTSPRAMGTLEVLPYFSTGTGDVVQRWSNGTQMYYRRLASSVWGTWVQVATSAAIPVASTSTLGAVIIGSGINVDAAGKISTVIQSINGKATLSVVLTAQDVQAIPTAALGAQGGAAQLDTSPNVPALTTDEYVYGRLLLDELPFNALQVQGTWDASTNHVNGDTSTSLITGGKAVLNVEPSGPATYATIGVPGYVYKVSVAGTTNLDGITSWSVGDLVASIAGTWVKLYAGTVSSVNVQTLAANSTMTASHFRGYLRYAGTADITYTIPLAATSGAVLGSTVELRQASIGRIQVVAATGVTVDLPFGTSSMYSAGLGATIKLVYVGSDTWDAIGQYQEV